jgi:hypothetical protein
MPTAKPLFNAHPRNGFYPAPRPVRRLADLTRRDSRRGRKAVKRIARLMARYTGKATR